MEEKTKLKVFGGLIVNAKGEQVRAIVACKYKKDALAILKKEYSWTFSRYHFNNYWCKTGNEIELESANRNPHKLLVAINREETKFEEYNKGD